MGPLEQAHRRLQFLYEVSKLLTAFERLDDTLPAVVAIVTRALPLRSAIFVLATGGRSRTIAWQAADESAPRLRGAKAHAQRSYAYLVGTAASGGQDSPTDVGVAEPTVEVFEKQNFVTLPLATAGRRILGALQLEGATRFDEMDLVFVNSIVNQLAVALDRQANLEAQQALTEARKVDAEDRQVAAEAARARAERIQRVAQAEQVEAERKRDAARAEREAGERRRAAAQALQERYEALVDNIDHAFVWEADARTLDVSYLSARAQTLLGYPRDRWRGNADFWTSCVHPEDRDAVADTFRKALSERKDQRFDHRCLTAEDRVLWFHTGVHLAQIDTPTPQLQGVSVDITAAKHAEEKIRAQLDFTRAVTESLGEGVLAVDLEGRLTLINSAAAAMLGWKGEDAIGRLVEDVLQIQRQDGTRVSSRESPFHFVQSGEALQSEEFKVSSRGQRAFPAKYASTALRRGGQVSGAVLAFEDIGDRKRAESELHDAIEDARAATRAREELLAIVSHDLKSPLGVILMNAAVMNTNLGDEDSRRVAKQIGSITRSVERMTRLIQDLLDTASIDAGKLSIEQRRLAVAPLVNETIEAMLPLAHSKSVDLNSQLPAKLSAIFADPGRLQQVFANLIGNAIKFTSPGGAITVRAEEVQGALRFSVTDTGSGISEENLPHLFDRFWQAPRTARQGTGLGLSIVKGIVAAHGGQIWVESRVGIGSTFHFTLPIGLRDSLESDGDENAQDAEEATIFGIEIETHATALAELEAESRKGETGRLTTHVSTFDVRKVAAEVVAELRPYADEKGLLLGFTVASQEAAMTSDLELTRLILLNLVGNSIQFTERGGVEISIDCAEGACSFAVRDSGPGIPAHERIRIFEPSTKGKDMAQSSFAGVGLGLALAREVASALGGEVELESEIGRGSTFTFTLPSPP